ncbi:MAG: mannitol dehydrogenase family protein, partial [Synergistaceae bacterium]|nr:mannitol dehydrogenase family protein [Synergistaceae bacterium]
PVVQNPGIISPRAFLKECLEVRFPNPYLGDTSARIATDISQGLAFRFGETVKAYAARDGSAKNLKGIPLAIAGWLRYLLAVDDEGNAFELSPDPMNAEMTQKFAGIQFGKPETLDGQLEPVLRNTHIFGVDLWDAGLGEKITEMFREMLKGKGAVRAALKKYLA